MTVLLWTLVAVLIIVGIAGTVLPALPGVVLVLAGIVLGAWIGDFQQVGIWAIVLCTVLAIIAWVTDYLAAMMGAKRVGAHPYALIGAALGTVVGLFMGFVGLLFMPLLGAAAGEWLAAHRDPEILRRAAVVGVATWVGLLVGTALKIALTFTMVGVFLAALLF